MVGRQKKKVLPGHLGCWAGDQEQGLEIGISRGNGEISHVCHKKQCSAKKFYLYNRGLVDRAIKTKNK